MANLQDAPQMKWSTFFLTFLITMGQWSFGFPASIISTTLAEPPFQEYMGLVDLKTGLPTSNAHSLEGATSGVFNAGAFINTFITAWVLDRFGRKGAVWYNAVVGLLGGALCVGSVNIGMFIAGRFFTGMSAIGFLALTPVYSAELAPPHWRGFFVGMNGFNIAFGYCMAAWTGVGCFYAVDPVARWRVPLGIYLFFPILMICLMFVVPESPRWLLMQGRVEEARKITERLHRTTKQPNDDFVRAEFYQMQKQAEVDRTLDASWLTMFSRKYRKRTLICMFYAFIGQSTAILVINNYGPTFYAALGYNTQDQLFFTAGWVTVSIFACFAGACGIDRLGRRTLMLTGVGGCVICLCAICGLVATYAGTTNAAGQAGGVAMLFLFNFLYNLGVDVGGNVFYAEAFPNHVRGKGVALANAVLAAADLVYLEVTPTAFAHIGWKFFLVFLCVSAVGFVILFIYLPETKGIPLEEMAKVFGDEDDIAVKTAELQNNLDLEMEIEKPEVVVQQKEHA